MFVYNQMGGIDEVALDCLSLVTEMTRHIHVRASGGKVSASKLGQFSPVFIWLPRDFHLDWVEDNRKITPRDYLQLALRPVQGGEKDVAAKNMECQIKAVLYVDEIEPYAEMLKLVNTYLISTARVKISQTSHGKPIHKFYWVLDKETVIEHITPSNGVENPLPPPTKLNLTTFDRIPHMMLYSAVEIDILAIVLRCSPQKYAGRSNHKCQEIIICDNQAKENKSMLLGRASNKTSTSSFAPLMMGLFYVEVEMAISDELQDFCVLECSGCKQKKRTKDRKDFHCPKCNRKTTLLPRCIFQIDLTDGTAIVTASISAELGEKLLTMTAEDIFDITCAKRQYLHINHVHEVLSNKLFQIQLRKSSWGTSNNTQATYSIISYMEKQHTPPTTIDRNSKKVRPLEISEMEVTETTTAAGSSNATLKFEPPTPTKKL
uniref:Replication factor A C-terminal domain-containing protein n=1 Tax=Solanum lycopersicum TaxID=4081 RepID=A0A3Q7HMD6_SOLLC